MVAIREDLTGQVRLFLESGDRSFLHTMMDMDRNSIEAQAVVRYLMQLKHWPFTPGTEFSDVMNRFFAEFPERAKRLPEEYRATTFSLIKDSFDYECIEIVPEPKPQPAEEKKQARKTKPAARKAEHVVEGHDDDISDVGVDTDGASDRLKRVIAIQRAG